MSQTDLMRSRRFAPLFLTQFLGAFNDNVFRFALIIFVTFTVAERTGIDTRMLVVLTGGIFILPFFIFSALAGQLADKYEKSSLIRRIKTCEIAVMALGAIGFWLGNYYFLLAVLFLMGAQSTFFGPLKYAVLPQHLDMAELTGGNGLIQMGTYIAILSGGMLGGMLASLVGIGPLAVVLTVVALAVAGRCASAYIPLAPASDPALTIDYRVFQSTWTIMKYGFAERSIGTLILLISGFWFTGATYLSIVPTYGKSLLGADEQVVTLLNAAFTIGIGSGAMICERLSRGRIELGIVPLAALGITLASLDVWLADTTPAPAATLALTNFLEHPPAVRLFVDLVLIGASGALYIVPLYAALQQRTSATRCSRVLAALNVNNALFMVVSAAFTISLYALGARAQDVFGIVALLNIAAMLAAMRALPEFRERLATLFSPRR